ncbi:MAG: hypothetical protein JWN46_1593 [Acidimicrobiales bacterium]|nr:hypothetical protein [Acidimicrobiales bacterium]
MARRRSRHLVPRSRRATPRRWPALLAIPALLAVAGVLDRGHQQRQPIVRTDASSAAVDPALLLPIASRSSALSSTWFCAGGSARGADGQAEMSVLVANVMSHSVPAELTAYDQHGQTSTKRITVPATGRVRVNVADFHQANWVAVMVEVFGGQAAVERLVKGPNGFSAGPCASASSNHWYFAEGSTLRGAEEYLALFNPYPDGASVDIRFSTEAGVRSPRAYQGYQVPGRSVRVVRITNEVTRRERVAASVVTRSGNLIVDRVQTFDGTGDKVGAAGAPQTAAPRGLVVGPGAPDTSTTWYFPDGRKIDGARSQIWVYNPTDRATTVDIAVALDDPQRNGVLDPSPLAVPAGEVRSLDLTAQGTIPVGVGHSITVRSRDGVGVVADQLLSAGPPWARRGVTVTTGAPVLAGAWLFPGGSTTPDQTEQLVVANPGSTSVRVTVEVLASGRILTLPALSQVEVPSHGRVLLDPSLFKLADVPLVVRASGPVAVERLLLLKARPGIALSFGLPLPETIASPASG